MSSMAKQGASPIPDQAFDRPLPLASEPLQPLGHWQEATVPDTLDLAQRAALAVNVLTANVKPEFGYALTQSFHFASQPPQEGLPNWMPMKFVRALPLMRTMSGNTARLDVEAATMTAILKQIGADGQIYCPISADGPPAETSYPVMNGIAVLALLTWYGRDPNPVWLEWAKLAIKGLKAALIEVDDYAYIPPECSLDRAGQWQWTLRGDQRWPPGYTPYIPPAEPSSDQQGFEGAVKWEQSNVIKAFVRAYTVWGDAEALVCAQKLARFCLKPNLWEQTQVPGEPGSEHGIWAGHVHGNLNSLQALLDLAVATHDERLKQIVRQGYEYGRQQGVIRLGWMPSWLAPQRFGRPASASVESEGCGIADLLMLAVQLCDAGLGDYWDDVDAIVRNHLSELQITDLALLRCACGSADDDPLLQKFIGGFTQAALTGNLRSEVSGCCTGNGARALYHAWEGITRFAGGVATVNLFLNRTSAWLDIDSHLPYEGKVLLHNKQAHTMFVRIPFWVDRQRLTCFVNDRPPTVAPIGQSILLSNLQPGDVVRLEFPISETTESYTIGDTPYTALLRSSTVVDIQPRATDNAENRNKIPYFVRQDLRHDAAPLRTVRRFVAERLNSVF